MVFFGESGISEISVGAPTRSEVETLFNILEQHAPESRLPKLEAAKPAPVIFIGHGRSALWRDLKDHLQDKQSSCAFLVLTGEDEASDKRLLARQNMVHETGLFQGRLGFSRAIVLLEEGTEEFTNLSGVHQIRFSKGNIKETFGDVLAVLRREFGT